MISFVHFKVGNQDFILDTNVTQYIVNISSVKFFSLAGNKKDYVRGLFVGRNNVTTLAIRLSKYCSIASEEKDEKYLIAFSNRYAIIVDEVVNVFLADEKNFVISPVKSKFVKRIYKDGEHGLLRELNLEYILSVISSIEIEKSAK